MLCASPGAAWDHRGMTRRQGCEGARNGSYTRTREAVVAAGHKGQRDETGNCIYGNLLGIWRIRQVCE